MKRALGIDIGGTTIKGGIVEVDGGARVAEGFVHFDKAVPAAEIWDRVAELVGRLEDEAGESFPRIGVGCAGLFDRATGEVLASANMPNLEGERLPDGVAAALGGNREVLLENDANVAAFGEQWFGAGVDVRDLVLVTLGTGVGGGVVLGDELFLGPRGNAGELGHVVVHPRPSGGPYDAPYAEELECACGSYGCGERLISATAAARRARAAGLTDDLVALCATARAADGPERALLHEIGRDLGSTLATMVTLFDVGNFAIGGGFGAALDLLLPGASEVLEERRYGTRPVSVVPAKLGGDAGWIGAARLTL
ncbi:MAG: ROK family protein [Planctomycetota bacterium]